MRFEISILVVGALSIVLVAITGTLFHGLDELSLHLLLALPASMAAALPHVWIAVYLFGTRRALAREPGAEADLPAARALALWALGAGLVALAAIVALTLAGARAYSAGYGASTHGTLFWVLLAVQPAALAIEWRMLARNHRLLVRYGG